MLEDDKGFGFVTPEAKYHDPLGDFTGVTPGWMLEEDKLPVDSGGFMPVLRYPNPLEDAPETDPGVDVLDVTAGWMLEDDKLQIGRAHV